MELEAHDRGYAPRFSNQGFQHDISDDDFGFRAGFWVKTWPELGCCGHGYVEEKEYKDRRHILCTSRWVCKIVQFDELYGPLYNLLKSI